MRRILGFEREKLTFNYVNNFEIKLLNGSIGGEKMSLSDFMDLFSFCDEGCLIVEKHKKIFVVLLKKDLVHMVSYNVGPRTKINQQEASFFIPSIHSSFSDFSP